MDLRYPSKKIEQDKKDCENLIKDLGINSENKKEFIKNYGFYKNIEIAEEHLERVLLMVEKKNCVVDSINKVMDKLNNQEAHETN